MKATIVSSSMAAASPSVASRINTFIGGSARSRGATGSASQALQQFCERTCRRVDVRGQAMVVVDQ